MQLGYVGFRYRKATVFTAYVSHGIFTLGGPTVTTYFDNHTAKGFTLLNCVLRYCELAAVTIAS